MACGRCINLGEDNKKLMDGTISTDRSFVFSTANLFFCFRTRPRCRLSPAP